MNAESKFSLEYYYEKTNKIICHNAKGKIPDIPYLIFNFHKLVFLVIMQIELLEQHWKNFLTLL